MLINKRNEQDAKEAKKHIENKKIVIISFLSRKLH